MSEIQVLAAPAVKDEEAFRKEVRTSISKISNLCGWDKDEREFLMESVGCSTLVLDQWFELQRHAQQQRGELATWEWNRFVRNATDQMVESFYRKSTSCKKLD